MLAAAGNHSRNIDHTPVYPASFSLTNIVAVAASTSQDQLASFTNYGSGTVDIAAPGVSIYSTYHLFDTSYAKHNGTSMAAPIVTGMLALARAQYPGDSQNVLIHRLLNSADRISALVGRLRVPGRVNLYHLLRGVGGSPPNDKFNLAQDISGYNFSWNGNNSEASQEAGEPNPGGRATGKSVWFRWTAPASGSAFFSVLGSPVPAVLGIYQGTQVNALQRLADSLSDNSFPAKEGQVYYLFLDGLDGAEGDLAFDLKIGPNNASFENAQVIPDMPFQIIGSNRNAGREVGEPLQVRMATLNTVWYSWTAPHSDQVQIHTLGSPLDTVVSVYRGEGGLSNLELVAENDDVGLGIPGSLLSFNAEEGVRYWIQVGAPGDRQGEFKLTGTWGTLQILAFENETFHSFDGIEFLRCVGPNDSPIRRVESVFFIDNQYVLFQQDARWSSGDGVSFTPERTNAGVLSVLYDGERYWALGGSSNNSLLESIDGLHWNAVRAVPEDALKYGIFLVGSNLWIGGIQAFRDPQMDLAVRLFPQLPAVIGVGDFIPADVEISNPGSESTGLIVRPVMHLWLAQDGAGPVSDRVSLEIHDLDAFSLSPGDAIRIQREIPLPSTLPPGEYHLGLEIEVDEWHPEINKANNSTHSLLPWIRVPARSLHLQVHGSGMVIPSVAGPVYPHKAPVTLTPIPIGASQFAGWSGDAARGVLGPVTVLLDRDRTIGAQFLRFAGAPFIEREPLDRQGLPGQNLLLEVAASGDRPLSYLWFRNGSPLPDSNSPRLHLTGITEANAGLYQVEVGNPHGNALSRLAQVTLGEPDPFALLDGDADYGHRRGWLRSSWLGLVHTDSWPWVYHVTHGWIMILPAEPDGFWIYMPGHGWFWTSPEVYPFLLSREASTWFYYLPNSHNPRSFYNYLTGEWEMWED